ncbi:MAG: DUF6090 family protein [Pseudomonadota bacterium]
MLLRRITTHVKEQNWFAVGVDFIIVVIGVFIGIQVANWNDTRTNEYRETEILGTIYNELKEDRIELQIGRDAAIVTISSASYVLKAAGVDVDEELVLPTSRMLDTATTSDAILVPVAISFSEDQKQRLWSSIVVGYYPTINATSIEALIGAGSLDMITDETIRENLQGYRNNAVALRGSQADTIKAFRTIAVRAGQERGYSPFSRTADQDFIERVKDDDELLAVIATQREYAALHLALIESTDNAASQLLAQIETLGLE